MAFQDVSAALSELTWLHESQKISRSVDQKRVLDRLPTILSAVLTLLARFTGADFLVNYIIPRNSSFKVDHYIGASSRMQEFLADSRGEASLSLVQEWFRSAESPFGNCPSNQLPPFDPKNPYTPINKSIQDLTRAAGEGQGLLPQLPELQRLIQLYEQYGPPHGIFDPNRPCRVPKPFFLPQSAPIDEDVATWILTPLPLIFALPDCVSGFGQFVQWTESSPFLDDATGLQLGGPGGVRVGLFAVLRILLLGPDILLQRTGHFADLLIEQIQHSINLIEAPKRPWCRLKTTKFDVHILEEYQPTKHASRRERQVLLNDTLDLSKPDVSLSNPAGAEIVMNIHPKPSQPSAECPDHVLQASRAPQRSLFGLFMRSHRERMERNNALLGLRFPEPEPTRQDKPIITLPAANSRTASSIMVHDSDSDSDDK